jgi:diguanylate cyclase (GGDEF)-like protein/PAS domain S-box-containing protein
VPTDADALVELTRALERFPSLFSLSPDAIALYRPDGTIVAGNSAARALVGASGHELIGAHFSRHMDARELERVDEYLRAALSGEPVEFETLFTDRDGEAINVVARVIPAFVGGTIVGVFGIARDISPQRRAEAGRDESREQFRSLFEQHPDSISMLDANGKYARINAAAERLLGYRSDEVAGRKVGMVVPRGAGEELDRYVHEVVSAGRPTRYETTLVRKDGSQAAVEGTAVPIVVNEQVTGLFLMSRDVTDRKRMQDGLALQSRRTRALYRLASEIGADPDEQVNSALAFGLKELGLQTAFVAALDGEALAIERNIGAPLVVDAGDSVLGQLCRETVAGSRLLELDAAALKRRSADAGRKSPFCRAFIGVPLDVESGRYGALCFVSRNATGPLGDFDREFVRAVAELAAVSIERALQRKRLSGLAHFDALTGLPNRLLLSDRFAQAIATAERRGEHVAVYFIDVDKFKAINDTHGHLVGDEVLRTVASRLRRACRESDTVARLGGDEFIVLQPGPLQGAGFGVLAARLRKELEAPCEIEGLQLKVSAGIGISIYPQDGKDERALLESADAALYAAKACGAGSIRRFGAGSPEAGAAPATCLGRRPRPAEAESQGAARRA